MDVQHFKRVAWSAAAAEDISAYLIGLYVLHLVHLTASVKLCSSLSPILFTFAIFNFTRSLMCSMRFCI